VSFDYLGNLRKFKKKPFLKEERGNEKPNQGVRERKMLETAGIDNRLKDGGERQEDS
jgi:hypothetical protein